MARTDEANRGSPPARESVGRIAGADHLVTTTHPIALLLGVVSLAVLLVAYVPRPLWGSKPTPPS